MHRELKFGKVTKRRNYDWVPGLLKTLLQILLVCLLAFIIVLNYGRKVSCAGDSMNPTLEHGDIVLVDRFRYNAASPRRGDVVVFKLGGNENSHANLKRVIAVPGDKLQIKEGKIYINDKVLEKDFIFDEIAEPGIASEEIVLNENEFFIIGDNPQSSKDSRVFGPIERSEIIGKAWFVFQPVKHSGFIK